LYADPRTEIRRLLDKYHCGRYKVYNFASELAQMTPPTHVVDTKVERYGCARINLPSHESAAQVVSRMTRWILVGFSHMRFRMRGSLWSSLVSGY